MPELPEVETIRLQLEDKIKNKRIAKVEVLQPRMINVSAKEFVKRVEKSKVKGIRRRAKLLIIDLSSGYSLIIHLKLTGNLIYNQESDKYTNVVFEFSGRKKLLYKDIRKFGYMKLIKTSEVPTFLDKQGFGPEPLDKSFTLEKFKEILFKKKRSKIKPLLMDQSFLAGVGNIYAQEACFYAKINPKRTAGSLTNKEIKDLYEGLRKIMAASIKFRGSSVDTYVDLFGKEGQFVPRLKIYRRSGKKCLRCKAKLKTIKLAGRGTTFCPKCQK